MSTTTNRLHGGQNINGFLASRGTDVLALSAALFKERGHLVQGELIQEWSPMAGGINPHRCAWQPSAIFTAILLSQQVNAGDAIFYEKSPHCFTYASDSVRLNFPSARNRFSVQQIESKQADVDEENKAELEAEFNERAERWENQAAVYSAPGATYLHRDYISIIAKGMANKKAIVPLILKRLPNAGVDWFFALQNIAGENPAMDANSYEDAIMAWQNWAIQNGI